MSDLRTAAQQAVEAMEAADVDPHSSDAVYKAITALKAALAELDKDDALIARHTCSVGMTVNGAQSISTTNGANTTAV